MKRLSFAQVAAVSGALALSACNVNFDADFEGGVPLADLDTAGAAPTTVMLASGDTVIVTEGEPFAITVSGDDAATRDLLFKLDDNSIGIGRDGNWKGNEVATIAITMPQLHEIDMAGSGKIVAPRLSGDAEVNIAGSGSTTIRRVEAETLSVNIMGSGELTAAGAANTLDLNVAGSGRLSGRGLKVANAEINIAGSGGGVFSSDGKVTASIAGSGDTIVYGKADCSADSVGSGTLTCRADGQ